MIAAAACLLFGLAVLNFFRINEANELSLISLVRITTARTDVISIVKNTDPATALFAPRLDEILDRHVIVVDDAKNLAAEKDHCIVLSAVQSTNAVAPVAQSPVRQPSRMAGVIDWFHRTISRRRAGDRLELADTYYLYEPKR